MATYKYRAINPRGRTLAGTLGAINELDLQHQLLQAGLTLIESRPQYETGLNTARFHPIRHLDLVQLCLNLGQLENADVKLTDNLRDVAEVTENSRLQQALLRVQQEVSSGIPLSHALERYKDVFPHLMVALIRAGEATGKLANAFSDLAKHFEWQEKLRGKLQRAASYPFFCLVTMFGVLALMLGYVVPEVTQFLYSLSVPLPFYTTLLISLSGIATAYGQAFLFALIGITAGTIIAMRQSREIHYKASAILLRLPIAGKLIRQINIARFIHTFSLVYNTGLGMMAAIDTAKDTVSNLLLHESIGIIQEQVRNGTPLSLAMKLSGEFPNLVQRMMKIGEESGQLETALQHITDYYEQSVQQNIETTIGTIGPTLTLVAGGLLIWIAIAVFSPVYNALPQLMS